MEKPIALIAGSTGLTGGFLLKALLVSGEYSTVKAIVRRPTEPDQPGLTTVVADFDRLEELADALKARDVFCCLGTTIRKAGSQEAFRKVDLEYPLTLARLSLAQGAKRFFLVTSIGADPRSRVFYNRTKGEVEEAIGKLPFEAIRIFRPSLLMGDRKESRFGESVAKAIAGPLRFALVGSFRRYRPIQAETVAHAMIESAKDPRPGLRIYESEEIRDLAGED
jgi:uncharacterized protein YbjT (DUF2867 family)